MRKEISFGLLIISFLKLYAHSDSQILNKLKSDEVSIEIVKEAAIDAVDPMVSIEEITVNGQKQFEYYKVYAKIIRGDDKTVDKVQLNMNFLEKKKYLIYLKNMYVFMKDCKSEDETIYSEARNEFWKKMNVSESKYSTIYFKGMLQTNGDIYFTIEFYMGAYYNDLENKILGQQFSFKYIDELFFQTPARSLAYPYVYQVQNGVLYRNSTSVSNVTDLYTPIVYKPSGLLVLSACQSSNLFCSNIQYCGVIGTGTYDFTISNRWLVSDLKIFKINSNLMHKYYIKKMNGLDGFNENRFESLNNSNLSVTNDLIHIEEN